MRFKSATKPLLRRYDALLAAREALSTAVYEAAFPRRDVPWQTCFRDYADDSLRQRYTAADRDVLDFQISMSTERRGYFDNGRFAWY